MWLAALIVLVTVVVLYWIKELRGPAPSAGLKLPPMVVGLPFIGSALKMGSHPFNFAMENYKKHGEIFSCIAMGSRLTFLTGPEPHRIFMTPTDEELNQEEPYQFSVPIFGPGVVYDVPHKIRSQQMRFMSKSLDPAHLKSYIPKIVDETEKFFSSWPEEGEVDLRDAFADLIIMTASRALMGDEVRATMHEKVARLYNTLDEGLLPISTMLPYLPIPAHRRRDAARAEMVALFREVMKARKAENPPRPHEDVLQVFMDARYRPTEEDGEAAKEGRGLDEVEVAGLMIALLFAGQHTSSISATWTGMHMLRNKEVLARVISEQQAAIDAHGMTLEWEGLNGMKLLHSCIKEAIRLGPPLIFLMRKTMRDFTYKNYFIPKGDVLFVSPAVAHTLPNVFSNPDKFDPDRYDRGEDKDEFSFIGFGGGRHACMGQQFAYMQSKTIWSTLLRNFELTPIGELPKHDYHAMVVGPTKPCKIHFRRRKLGASAAPAPSAASAAH